MEKDLKRIRCEERPLSGFPLGALFDPRDGGKIEAYGTRGIYVPPGMTAAEIFEGAKALQREMDRLSHDVTLYDAQSIVVAILRTIRSPDVAEQKTP